MDSFSKIKSLFAMFLQFKIFQRMFKVSRIKSKKLKEFVNKCAS